jgi:hypothetical protein
VDGSGLGLPIVREIAQRHGAAVSVDIAHPGQTPSGAWSKAVDCSATQRLAAQHWTSQSGDGWHYCGTLDNRTTTSQLIYLAAFTEATSDSDARLAGPRQRLPAVLQRVPMRCALSKRWQVQGLCIPQVHKSNWLTIHYNAVTAPRAVTGRCSLPWLTVSVGVFCHASLRLPW